MNDFTKEELETLAACVSTYAKDDPEDYLPLFDKICVMINDSDECQHDWRQGKHLFTDTYCTKCHRTENDN